VVPDRTEIPLIQVSASAVPAVVGLLGGLSPSATSIRLDQMVFSSRFRGHPVRPSDAASPGTGPRELRVASAPVEHA